MAISSTSFKKGAANPRWNDEIQIDSKGYRRVRVGLEHPLSDGKGYCREHILVWIAANGKPPYGFDIHHKDENKLNNRIENLELIEAHEHGKRHNFMYRDNPALTPKNDGAGYAPPDDDIPYR